MLAAILASGLLWHAADDVDAMLAQISAARAAHNRCVFQQAKARYRGSSGPDLEKAVNEACQSELSAYADAILVGSNATANAAARSAFIASMPQAVHMVVLMAVMCVNNSGKLGAREESLCATGGF